MKKNTNLNNKLMNSIIRNVSKLCENKSYSPTLLNYLYLIVYGMISFYGTSYTDLIYSVIAENDIFIGLEAFEKENPKEINSWAKTFNKKNEAFVCQKVIKQEDNYKILNQICILHNIEKEESINPIFILEFLTHELNHILTSKRKNFFYLNGKLACRCGLFRFVLSQKENEFASGKTLSEVINTLQTEDIIKEILYLNYREIEHIGVSTILKSIQSFSPITYTNKSYINEVSLFRDLYSNPNYKELINNCTLEGEIEEFISDFDKNVGANAYQKFTTLYDKYSTHLIKGQKNKWRKKDIQTTALTAKKIRSLITSYKNKKYPAMKWS